MERENATADLSQLRAFQHKVRAQVERHDPGLAEELIAAAQDLIEQADDRLEPKQATKPKQ